MIILDEISKHWFFSEPLLFCTLCTHTLKENANIKIPFRTGNRVIEYNPDIISLFPESTVEQLLKIEIIRILLKHPYQRQPDNATKIYLGIASNMVISDSCEIYTGITPDFFAFPKGLCFEEYYEKIQQLSSKSNTKTYGMNHTGENHADNDGKKAKNKTDSDGTHHNTKKPEEISSQNNGNSADNINGSYNLICHYVNTHEGMSDNWSEDEEMCINVNGVIEQAMQTQQWGSLPMQLAEVIMASLHPRLDYKRIFRIFNTSILSSKRALTRLRPSRRFGFAQMGSKYNLCSNLLVAVDVSGSVSSDSIRYFYSAVNHFFKYGIEAIDVIQFDAELKTPNPISMKTATIRTEILGRGGTDFQLAADYYDTHPKYDGLIYFTDGYASLPSFHQLRKPKVLWVIDSWENYRRFKEQLLPKNYYVTFIPS